MTEEQAAEPAGERRRWPWVVGGIGLVVALAVGVFLYARPGPSFQSLFEATHSAETDPLWATYFTAQDCFVAAVLDVGDPDLAYEDGLALLDQADRLAIHVDSALQAFDGLPIRPWHDEIESAREAIVGHYQVWDEHLLRLLGILDGLTEDPEELAALFDEWIDEVVEASTPIEDTYNEAKAAFLAAATDDASRNDIEELFTPSDVECSRGAV
ncbi:MAG TPA: hypothetical protein VJR05_05915 [Acidimicrobiia bacterium]|nr:hypothetical protein [Acidimicrobiia bacterium]